MSCEGCDYRKDYCSRYICSKKLKDEKIIKHRIKYEKSEDLFVVERGGGD